MFSILIADPYHPKEFFLETGCYSPSNIVRSGEKQIRNVVTSVWLRRRIDSRQLWLTSRLIKDSRSWDQWVRTLIFRIDGSLDNPWYNTKAKRISSCAPRLNLVLWPSPYRILLATSSHPPLLARRDALWRRASLDRLLDFLNVQLSVDSSLIVSMAEARQREKFHTTLSHSRRGFLQTMCVCVCLCVWYAEIEVQPSREIAGNPLISPRATRAGDHRRRGFFARFITLKGLFAGHAARKTARITLHAWRTPNDRVKGERFL